MATRYWVGGSGTWDTSDTTHWSTSSGGASGASAPTSSDDVVFDNSSIAAPGSITATVTTGNCLSLTTSAMTAPRDVSIYGNTTGVLNIYGSFTGGTRSNFANIGVNFKSTSSGNTITSGGSGQYQNARVTFDGVGGEWTLQDTYDAGSIGGYISIVNGNLISGANTLEFQATLPSPSFYMTAGAILTLTSGTLNLRATNTTIAGTSGNPIVITGGTINSSSGSLSVSYVTLTGNTAAGGSIPFTDTNGTDGGSNTNWNFATSAVQVGGSFLLNFV